MANLNLSQFGENSSVSDADYTFVWDSANAISKKVSRNSWLNSGTLTSDAPVTISQTWAGTNSTVFKALVVNADGSSETNSASGSLLLDLQLGGVSKFNVYKSGNIHVDPTSALAVLSFSVGAYTAFEYYGGSGWGNQPFTIKARNGLSINSSIGRHQLLFAGDTILLRDEAANTLALRNGAAAQTFNVYGTYTSGTVYERMFMRYNGTDLAFQVGAETLGATARPLQLWTGGASRLHITTAGNVGIGTTSPTSKLHVAETWNAAGTTFTAVNVNVTDTASAATSKLLDLQIGGASRFSVEKDRVNLGTQGYYSNSGNSPRLCSTSGLPLYLAAGGDVAAIGFTVKPDLSVQIGGYTDGCRFYKDGNHQLGLRDGANGQTFSVYGTYPGAAWERFTITAPTSGNVLLGTYQGTGGIARGLEFQTAGVTRMTLGTTEITTTVPFTASGLGKFVGIQLGTSGSSRLVSPGYGIATFLDSDGTGNFTKLNLAGNTDSFPSLKRSTTRIQAVLATTDTTFTNIQGKLTTDTDYTATVVTPTGFLTLYDAQGTAYRVPCVPA